jgi:hypothetical protein
MRRNLWVICGTVCVVLGVIGIVIPILPTTPFLLLATFCYTRGSERFNNWLVNRSFLGSYIHNYREGRGISLKQKLLTIFILWLTISFTIGLAATTWWLKILLLIVAVGVTIHLIKIKTLQQEITDQAGPANSSEAVEAS